MPEVTDQEVWYIVAGACGLLLLMVIYLTRRIPWWWLKSLLRALVAVLLLVPAMVPGQEGFHAPAFVIALFEIFFQEQANPEPAIRALVSVSIAATVLVLIFVLARWFITRPKPALDSAAQAPDPSPPEMPAES